MGAMQAIVIDVLAFYSHVQIKGYFGWSHAQVLQLIQGRKF